MDVLSRLARAGVVPVVVIDDAKDAVPTANAMVAGGIDVMEITFRTAAAPEAIRAVAESCPDMLVGAGTILNTCDLKRAADAGAKFAVAPGFNPTVVKAAMEMKFDFAPGICTPGEIEQAYELGCRFFKFFPAEAAGGVKMLKAIAAPYKHLGIKFMPTGGVTMENAASYLALEEVAAAGGTWLNKATEEEIRLAADLAKSL